MILAFISDIHGNAVALEAVIKDLKEKNVDKVFVLGDISYRGPEPKRSLDLVRSLNCDVIKGNADEWVVRGIREGEVPEQALETMRKEREWIVSRMDDESIEYLKNLPTDITFENQGTRIHAFHATPNSLFEVVQPIESDEHMIEKMMSNDADIYIYAHIHKPFIRYINGKCLINIGSVGLPFDGMAKSSYCLIDIEVNGFQSSIVRINYDVNQVVQQFNDSDYPNAGFMINALENGKL